MKYIFKGVLVAILFISTVFAQNPYDLINETFSSGFPADWTNSGAVITNSHLEIDGSDNVITKVVTDPDYLSFTYAKSSSATRGSVTIQYREEGNVTWTDLATLSPSSTGFTQYSKELSELASQPTGDVYFRLVSGVTKKTIFIDDFKATQGVVPSSTSLTGFTYEVSNGPSAEQSFSVSGTNLAANILINAPSNYEVSQSSGSGFGSSVSLSPSSGTVALTTIYVRLKESLSPGTYDSENITLTSTGKISKNVSCSGSVSGPPILNVKVFVEGSL